MTLQVRPVDDVASAVPGLVERYVHRRFAGEQGDLVGAHEAARAHVEKLLPRAELLEVIADGASEAPSDLPEVGRVWLVTDREDRAVIDVELADATQAPAVREAVEQHVRAAGVRRLTAVVSPGDRTTLAFLAGGAFELVATQMRLDLDGAAGTPAEQGDLRMVPMDDATYAAWEAEEVEKYAAARVRAGEPPERARQISHTQHAELLPQGLATEDQHFFMAFTTASDADAEPVGTLWLSTERPMVFVYDVVVAEAQRRRGYGRALMRAGADWARARGAHAIGLNVFGYNHGARALYDALGYLVVEDFLAQDLDP